MRWMMQGREKTRENQFVQPNTVPLASVVLMNFYLSLSLAHIYPFLSLPFLDRTADFPRRWIPGYKRKDKKWVGKGQGTTLKKYQLNTTEVAPITRDTFYFACRWQQGGTVIGILALSHVQIQRRALPTALGALCVCFMKTFLAKNFLGVCNGRREGRRWERRDARAGGIKVGLILIFKFCGETTVRSGNGESISGGIKRQGWDWERRIEGRERKEERMASHNRFSNS